MRNPALGASGVTEGCVRRGTIFSRVGGRGAFRIQERLRGHAAGNREEKAKDCQGGRLGLQERTRCGIGETDDSIQSGNGDEGYHAGMYCTSPTNPMSLQGSDLATPPRRKK